MGRNVSLPLVGLTDLELDVVRRLGEIAGDLSLIVGSNRRTRDHDINEMIVHVHALQHAVMAQAAARAHPREFRLLGEMVPE